MASYVPFMLFETSSKRVEEAVSEFGMRCFTLIGVDRTLRPISFHD